MTEAVDWDVKPQANQTDNYIYAVGTQRPVSLVVKWFFEYPQDMFSVDFNIRNHTSLLKA